MNIRKYMKFAEIYASQSYCKRKQVGCVITKEGRIVSSGYNGALKGQPNNCEDSNDETLSTVIHAEANAIMFAAKVGVSIKDTTLICTLSPCVECAKLIAGAGISKVIFKIAHSNQEGIDFLKKVGTEVEQLKDES